MRRYRAENGRAEKEATMTKQVPAIRTMDIHLLTRVEDDGSPFGAYARTVR